jgi:ring-1,2-phenylacetyl-CoA epoxidase subunit PaaD
MNGVDLAAVEAAAAGVPDPELPVVTLGDLGIVRGAALAGDGAVEVALTPTYVGCPATEAIAADVVRAVEAVVPGERVRTRTVLAPAWTTDWISAEGRRKLAEHGIAPPSGRSAHGAAQGAAGGAAGDPGAAPGPVPVDLAVRCPRCGSTETRLLSAFGSTPCQALRACRACGEPFGAVKSL